MATQMQSIGSGILEALKFELLPSLTEDGKEIFGGDQKYKVTPETVSFAQSIRDKDQVLILDSDGGIRVEDDGDVGPPSAPR